MKIRNGVQLLIFIFLFGLGFCNCKPFPELVETNYSFIDREKNKFSNELMLESFFKKIDSLQNGLKKTVTILHIGDSHLQADMLTEITRACLQKQWGNAGRGFITPHKLSRSNEPHDYKLLCDKPVISSRLLNREPIIPVGFGGVAIGFQSDSVKIILTEKEQLLQDYGFDKIKIFANTFTNTNWNISDTNNQKIVQKTISKGKNFIEYGLIDETNSIQFFLEKKDTNKILDDFFGLSLEKSSEGILYHSIGINGATFIDYIEHENLIEQWKQLQPDLIIVSLGTNESHKKTMNDEIMMRQCDSFLEIIKPNFNRTPFIITTPADGYKGFITNKFLHLVQIGLKQSAQKNNCAIWDLYDFTGGEGSAYNWRKNGLIGGDGVHYGKAGYRVQGQLLANAFFTSYINYKKRRKK